MGKYAWSSRINDEIWRGGPCDSVKECIEEARLEDYKDTDIFALGYIEPYQTNYVNGDLIIEHLQQNAYDEVGEVAECWLDDISREQIEDLNNRTEKGGVQG